MENVREGILYIVATPIGNLEDITLRALRVLREVQLIAAEDTRRTRKLLEFYRIDTPLTSLHEHSEGKKSDVLIEKIKGGIDVAYVSDAGTPGVSDPGYVLVSRAIAHGIKVVPVPGASAVIAALSVSGLPMDRFVFYGFLPTRKGKRRASLTMLKEEKKTLVFYESPGRLMATLSDILEVLGDRKVAVVRELTKLFEEIIRGYVSQVIETLRERTVKGEVTLVVEGAKESESSWSDEDIRDRYERMRSSGLSRRDLIARIASEMGVPRRRVYRIVTHQEQ